MKKSFRYIPVILFLLSAAAAAAASPVDSLYARFTSASGAERVRQAEALMDLLEAGDPPEAPFRFQKGISRPRVDAQVHYQMAEYCFSVGRYAESVNHGTEALDLIRERHFADLEPDCINIIGLSYFRLGNFKSALNYLQQCLERDEAAGDEAGMSSSLNNLAACYLADRQPAVAWDFMRRAIELERKRKDNRILSIRLGLASEILLAMEKPAEALPMAQEACQLTEEAGDSLRLGVRYSQLAGVYDALGEDGQAESLLRSAIPMLERAGNVNSLCISCNLLGKLLSEKGERTEARAYLQRAADIARQTGNLYTEKTSREQLFRLERSERPAVAMEQLERYSFLADSLYREESAKALEDFRALYETRELERRNELERSRRRTILSIFTLVTALLLLVLFLLVRLVSIERKRSAELKENDLIKNKFLSIISHDLRNPVVAQKNVLQLMVDNYDGLDRQTVFENCSQLYHSSESLLELLLTLLDWSRIETGRIRYSPVRMQVSEQVENAVKPLRYQMESKNIRLEADVPDDLFSLGDINMFTTVVRNLVSNAVKFSHAGGRVLVRARPGEEGKILVSVEDEGTGMTPEKVEALLRGLSSGSSAGTRSETGTGLGLVVCREMLSFTGERLQVSSRPGEGSCFSFRITRSE